MIHEAADQRDAGVSAAHDERDERILGPGFQKIGVDMGVDVVHSHQRNAEPHVQPFGEAHAHEQGAHQAGSVRHGDAGQVAGRDAGLIQGLTHHVRDVAVMRARGELRHHAAEALVHRLRADHVAPQAALAVVDGGRGFVAGRFDAEDHGCG